MKGIEEFLNIVYRSQDFLYSLQLFYISCLYDALSLLLDFVGGPVGQLPITPLTLGKEEEKRIDQRPKELVKRSVSEPYI